MGNGRSNGRVVDPIYSHVVERKFSILSHGFSIIASSIHTVHCILILLISISSSIKNNNQYRISKMWLMLIYRLDRSMFRIDRLVIVRRFAGVVAVRILLKSDGSIVLQHLSLLLPSRAVERAERDVDH